jgi:hypothetical protein
MNAPNHTDLYQGLGEVKAGQTMLERRMDRLEELVTSRFDKLDDRLAKMEAAENKRGGATSLALWLAGGAGGSAVALILVIIQHFWNR